MTTWRITRGERLDELADAERIVQARLWFDAREIARQRAGPSADVEFAPEPTPAPEPHP